MDAEGPHAHGHAAHSTGFKWLDISLALSAFLISLISLAVAVHHGKTMDRLVASNSYPNIDVDSSNLADLGDGRGNQPVLSISLVNTGIGPARLRSVELSYAGRPVESLTALIAACCTNPADGAMPKLNYEYTGSLAGAMLRAGGERALFRWRGAPDDPRWARLDKARERVRVRVCYCSVFDECYLRDNERTEPEHSAACPAPALPYSGR
jgi:hypothetical protein